VAAVERGDITRVVGYGQLNRHVHDPEQATSAASASSSGPRTVSSTVRAGPADAAAH
jgi:hypothetical protein